MSIPSDPKQRADLLLNHLIDAMSALDKAQKEKASPVLQEVLKARVERIKTELELLSTNIVPEK